jgi:hypothetical protein
VIGCAALAHHQFRAPRAFPLTGPPCPLLSPSRSARILLTLASILANSASAGSEFKLSCLPATGRGLRRSYAPGPTQRFR